MVRNIHMKWSESHSVMSDSLWPRGLYSPCNSPGQNIGVDSHSLLQGIFPTLGLNPGLPHCRRILYQLSHQGSPRILEWVVYPFFSGFSLPRNWSGVSCTAGRFLTSWVSREAQTYTQRMKHIMIRSFSDFFLSLFLSLPWNDRQTMTWSL